MLINEISTNPNIDGCAECGNHVDAPHRLCNRCIKLYRENNTENNYHDLVDIFESSYVND